MISPFSLTTLEVDSLTGASSTEGIPSVPGLFSCGLTKPIVESVVRNTLIDTEEIDVNTFRFTLHLVEEPNFFKITIAIHKSIYLLMLQKYFELKYLSIRHFWTHT